jgi:hypothetical protein
MAVQVLQQVVETMLKVVDKATAPLLKSADAADKVGRAHNAAAGALGQQGRGALNVLGKLEGVFQHLLPVAGSLGAVLSFKGMISTTESYIKSLKEVTELTGASAEQADFLFSSARKAGVEYNQMQRIMFMLSKRGAAMEETMAITNGRSAPGLLKKYQRMGVDITKGPVSALEQMARGVQKGQIDADNLMKTFQIPQGAVNDFKGFLEDLDPEKMKEAIASGMLVSPQDIASFNRVEGAQHRIADAFNRMQVMLGRRLLPAMASITEYVADKLENEWLPAAQRFGSYLAEHMDKIVLAAKVFVAVMTSRQLFSMLTALTSAEGILGKLAAGGIKSLLGGGVGGVAGLASSLGAAMNVLWAAGPALLAIGAAVFAIYQGYKYINANVGGIKDRLLLLWENMKARVDLLGDSLQRMWTTVAGIFGEEGDFSRFLGKLAALSFEGLAKSADFLIHLLQTVVSYFEEIGQQFDYLMTDVFGKNWWKEIIVDPFFRALGWLQNGLNTFFGWLQNSARWIADKFGVKLAEPNANNSMFDLKAPVEQFMRHWNKTEDQTRARAYQNRVDAGNKAAAEAAAAKRDAPTDREKKVFDFRGSRFDITQQFAEGFDPDRIAVAFANDLSSLGEMRSQSGFAPVFAAR